MASEDLFKPRLETALDGTQVTDLSDDYLLNTCGLTANEVATIRGMPACDLSTVIPLVIAIGKRRTELLQDKLPFKSEINLKGKRRCVYVEIDGTRCEGYGDHDIPVCKKHHKKALMLGNHFRSPALRDTFKKFHEDPHKMNCDAELSLMRTMLAALLNRITDDNLNIEIIAGVSAMCEKITSVIERISKLEKVTPEHLNLLMKQLTEVAAKYIPADKLEAFASEVEKISVEPDRITQAVPYLPGVEVEVNDGVEVVSVQKQALIETANRMGIVAGGET